VSGLGEGEHLCVGSLISSYLTCDFGSRWQILFYPNSGQEGGYVSLYLSCEPTAEEKEQAINGKWVREGLFKFSFELKS
jgi:hypothetical protein